MECPHRKQQVLQLQWEEEEDSAHHLMHEIWQTRMCLNMQRQLTQILLRPKPWFKLVCSNVVDLKRYFVFIHCPVRGLSKPEPHQPPFTSKNKCSDKQMRKTKNDKIKELPMKILCAAKQVLCWNKK